MIGPRLTLAAIYPTGERWAAQFYAGTEHAGALAGYASREECQAAAEAVLHQLGQRPQLLALASLSAADALAASLLPIQ